MERHQRRRTRAILLALMAIVLSVVLIAGGTFALFTDSVSVRTHLKAGTLHITLVRTAHSYSILDDDGYLETTAVDDEEVAAADIVNAFGLPVDNQGGLDALIVPTSVLSATFEVQNNDTVAFSYSIELVAIDATTGEEIDPEDRPALYGQLALKLTDSQGDHAMSEEATSLTIAGTDVVTVGSSKEFTVTVTFKNLDDSINNLAQDQEVYFDLVITAIQATDRP